jgi:hypothetical protein
MATPTSLPPVFSVGQYNTAALMNGLRGAFRILQVVSGTTTTVVETTSATFVDTTLSATITPQSNTSKIFVAVNQSAYVFTAVTECAFCLVRGSTTLQTQLAPIFSRADSIVGNVSFMYLDSPTSTSALTYKTQIRRASGGGSVFANINTNPANITLFEVSA